MTPRWNEEALSEKPNVKVLQALSCQHVDAEVCDSVLQGLRETVLALPVTKSLKRINPWLGANDTHSASPIGQVQTTSVLDANNDAHTAQIAPTYGACGAT